MEDCFVLTLAAPVWVRAANAEKTIRLNRMGNERIALDPIFFEQTGKLQLDIELFIGATHDLTHHIMCDRALRLRLATHLFIAAALCRRTPSTPRVAGRPTQRLPEHPTELQIARTNGGNR